MKGLSKGRYDETFAGEDVFSRESLKMFQTDWLILRVTHQPFEIE